MKNTTEKTLKEKQADILESLRSLCSDEITINPKQSDISRFSLTSLDTMINDYPNKRISENHGLEYFLRHLSNQFNYDIELRADRKLKISAVNLKKATGSKLILHVSTIQVSYSTLVEAKKLAEKLILIYDETSKFLKFPTGNWKKTLSKEYSAQTKKHSIGRYDGFDEKIANATNIVCSSCKYAWTQINMGDPDKSTFKCSNCGSRSLIQNRMNYNYRRDNVTGKAKHWGTQTLESLLESIDCFDRQFALLSKEDQNKILDRVARRDQIERSTLAGIVMDFHNGIGSKKTLLDVEKKATPYDKMTNAKLRKLANRNGYPKDGSKKSIDLREFLNGLENVK